ncbi:MAG: aminopeptidase P family protein [Acidobacteria bacterium]|nr:aminopeptidase P family protein [Acidobacteriota bacterium]
MVRIAAAGFLILEALLGGIADGVRAEAVRPEGAPFAQRRERLMERIGGSVAVLAGARDPAAYVPFRQDNNFYYLTGVEVPGALLLLDGVRRESLLFLPPRDRGLEQWEGERVFPGPEAERATGMDAVLDTARFGGELEERTGAAGVLYLPRSPRETAAVSRDRALDADEARRLDPWDGREPGRTAFERKLRGRVGPSVDIRDLAPVLDGMRRVKDAREIALLREAGRIGALGLREAMRSAAPGVYEYELAARAQFEFLRLGAMGYAFHPIVGSGPNSCVLHYSRNRRKMMPGEMVVMDFGPDYGYYAADVTRSFPVTGRFSAEQAKVYRAVLEAQEAVLGKVRPGATFRELETAADEALGRHGYGGRAPHRFVHHVGMAVHDVGDGAPLEPGVVIAVEPGVYLKEKNLGVRIEDTVLVTESGREVLTSGAPREIAGIEALMAEPAVMQPMQD